MQIEDITEEQLQAFTIVERVASVPSLLGCILIITSFCMSKAFHKPINRLVFYASIGNLMTNVATLMARSYVGDGNAAGCQLQAFMIQMFMPADAFWTLAMAVNVYLTFYCKYDAQKLRRMEIPYLLCCYGLPFIVALTYVFVQTGEKGRMYGNATIWCWISNSWDAWRIGTFYGPVWVVMVVTFFIYIRAGREIYRKHRQLKDLNYTSHYDSEPNPMNDPYSTKTTEVTVSVSDGPDAIGLAPMGVDAHSHIANIGQTLRPSAYSVSISALPTTTNASGSSTTTNPSAANTMSMYGATHSLPKSRRKAAMDANNSAWSYTKVALLFFTAMLVTWIPSSANRLYSLAKAGEISLPLEYMSASVLPLQGFWNAIIYCTTSWKACKMLGEDVAAFFRRAPTTRAAPSSTSFSGTLRSRSRLGTVLGKETTVGPTGKGRAFVKMPKDSETESMEELA
ncbi:hypothetical protein N0V93_006945 [Gnomoniopsis smithogilvyi]|uniref:G-protein coupled receptors family 2 profile 2 domain-containing protein n=1 Tax=Gnomoniopsis smithogilvyi TaxID=1191159 RepID=A0A9W8YQN4_9PEZI|nr:hypothetical protein N0V93_006945 [Gnomoniopsis smithogilvyi]